ncbi:9618_t:CDS:2, partial [Funneliformis mosseae]
SLHLPTSTTLVDTSLANSNELNIGLNYCKVRWTDRRGDSVYAIIIYTDMQVSDNLYNLTILISKELFADVQSEQFLVNEVATCSLCVNCERLSK